MWDLIVQTLEFGLVLYKEMSCEILKLTAKSLHVLICLFLNFLQKKWFCCVASAEPWEGFWTQHNFRKSGASLKLWWVPLESLSLEEIIIRKHILHYIYDIWWIITGIFWLDICSIQTGSFSIQVFYRVILLYIFLNSGVCVSIYLILKSYILYFMLV
jgi:hypothetical protein